MSFSASVKEELSKINSFSSIDQIKAELYGYCITMDMSKQKISFLTENEYNINRLNKLLKTLGVNYTINMKGNNYLIEFRKTSLNLEFEESQETKKAIVRGAFLGSGSLTEPDNRYHLEISVKKEEGRQKIIDIANEFGIEVKKLNRKYSYSIYIKDRRSDFEVLSINSGQIVQF